MSRIRRIVLAMYGHRKHATPPVEQRGLWGQWMGGLWVPNSPRHDNTPYHVPVAPHGCYEAMDDVLDLYQDVNPSDQYVFAPGNYGMPCA